MNNWIIILFIGLNLNLYSQSDSALHKRIQLLVDSTTFNYDTTGVSSFSIVPHPCDDIIQWNSYHVMDLNSDGLKDLIFSGTCGLYTSTILYFNTGNELKLTFECSGKVVSAKTESNSSTLNILKEACCCDKYAELIELTVGNNFDVIQNSIYIHIDTKISIENTFEELEFKGIMRSTPIVDDIGKPDECNDGTVEGNKLIETTEKTNVIQLSSYGNWSLVLFKENSARYRMGWIEIKE